MKKLFTAALGTLMIFGLAACGGSKKDPEPTPEPEKYDTTKRAVPEGYSVFAQGGALGWDLGIEGTEMAAASIKDVSGLSTDVADALQAKFDKASDEEKKGFYLYTLEVKLEGEAGWTTNVMKDGEVVAVDGANTIKGRMGHYDAEDEAWISDAWFPDPHLFHAESLTPSSLFIAENWAEEADEHGFDWTSNPAAYEQGTYKFVLALYTWVAPSATACNIGMALIK